MTDPVYVVGAYEHPTREAPEKSAAQLHAEVAAGALSDAGLPADAVDGLLTAGDPPASLPPLAMADYLGCSPAFYDTTDPGGSAYVSHVGHAASAIRDGKCDLCLITLAGRPRSAGQATGSGARELVSPQDSFERTYGVTNLTMYAMAARRHAHEFGTTPAQLAEVRAAASHHAQFNPDARFRDPVTVDEVLDSPVVADPLHLLDCCVITDGAGALLVAGEDVASTLDADRNVELLGHGEAVGHADAGRIDVTRTAAEDSGERAFAEAGVGPEAVEYASIYDSFTITVLEAIEDARRASRVQRHRRGRGAPGRRPPPVQHRRRGSLLEPPQSWGDDEGHRSGPAVARRDARRGAGGPRYRHRARDRREYRDASRRGHARPRRGVGVTDLPERWEPRPTPNVNPETEPYWRAASEGRLLLGECSNEDCGLVFHYPRPRCPDCLNEAGLVEASGEGEIYTYSVAGRVEGWPKGDLPLRVGYVELAEGPRLMTAFVDRDPEDLKIGRTVAVRFVPTEDRDVAVPVFTPV